MENNFHPGPENAATACEKILLVDDEAPVLEVGKEILAYHGFETITAENGKRALELYGREKENIGMVILDLNMPEVDGYECMQKILASDPKAKVFISTGYSTSTRVQELIDKGATGFIMKPYRFEDMVKTVRETLNGV